MGKQRPIASPGMTALCEVDVKFVNSDVPTTRSGGRLLSWFKKNPKQPEIRDTLFGDLPLAQWARVPADTLAVQPWSSFDSARKSIDSGDTKGGISSLQGILKMPDLESRHYSQAYSQLRQLGVDTPSESAKDVLGVVVEVGTDKGLDLVAAYADHHARYFNYSGAAVIWERPDPRLDAVIDNVLGSGGRLA